MPVSDQWTYFPAAMTANNLRSLRAAFQRACAISGASDEAERDLLASVIFRYYQRGLTEPDRLADLACFICGLGVRGDAITAAPPAAGHAVRVDASQPLAIPIVSLPSMDKGQLFQDHAIASLAAGNGGN
jgi:hypothetical protein